MTDIYLTRVLSGVAGADDAAVEYLRRWPIGETRKADVRKPRAHRSLRRYWALVRLVYQSSEQFKSEKQVHEFLKIRAGHCTQIHSKGTGEVYLVADSIDYDTIEDEEEFQQIWRRVTDVVCEDILPGVDRAELELEIMKLCGLAGGR